MEGDFVCCVLRRLISKVFQGELEAGTVVVVVGPDVAAVGETVSEVGKGQ